MRPVTYAVPKELLPIGSTPILDLVVEEAAGAGLEELALVVRPGKPALRAYVEARRGEPPYKGVTIEFVEQSEPTGLADAIGLCRQFTGDQPFAILLPDNLLMPSRSALTEMAELSEFEGCDVLGVIGVDSGRAHEYGNCGRFEYATRPDRALAINRLIDRGPGRMHVDPGQTVLRTCGRYVCRAHLYDYLDAARDPHADDWDERAAYKLLMKDHRLLGSVLHGKHFDVGNPDGYLSACAHAAQLRDHHR